MSSNNIYPYVYLCTHKTTKEFYFGVRFANKVPADLDLGVKYKTSSKHVKPRFHEFDYCVYAVMFSREDAAKLEAELIKDTWNEKLSLNMNCREHNHPDSVTVRDVSGKQFNVKKEVFASRSDLEHVTKGTTPVRDRNGNNFRVDCNDPRIASGELVHPYLGTVSCINPITKECYRVAKTDPEYINKVMIPIGSGRVTAINLETHKSENVSKEEYADNKGTKFIHVSSAKKYNLQLIDGVWV